MDRPTPVNRLKMDVTIVYRLMRYTDRCGDKGRVRMAMGRAPPEPSEGRLASQLGR